DHYSFGELRVSHEQNLIFADVRQSDVFALWTELKALGLATPNLGLLTNIVCCPGGDFCSLANAKSIPIAEAIQRRFDDLDYLHDDERFVDTVHRIGLEPFKERVYAAAAH